MLRLPTIIAFVLCTVASVVRAEETASITIERVQWGFDGKAQERTFVPLSVLVRNTAAIEFEGTLSLTKLIQKTQPVDATIERDVYVGPLSSRWVQFVPYVVSDWEQWRLVWGHVGDESDDIPAPRMGEQATVLLFDPGDLQVAGGVLRRFPTNLFPASVTATDGLRGVLISTPPQWQGARRQAFLDWLSLGGHVYLLQGDDGRFPTFPDSLGVLNGRGDRYSVGAGQVIRIDKTLRDLDPDYVKEHILNDPTDRPNAQRRREVSRSPAFNVTGPTINRQGWDRDTQMFLDLQSIARFSRQWWIIYLLSALYVFVLFPLCYRVSREAKDYRWTYLAFFSMVGLFSYGFASLSRLGAAETSRARSVAVAEQVQEGRYDVTQWTCLAVKQSGTYTVTHDGDGRIYSTAQDMERIDGTITAGVSAKMELDIPPASTRTSLHRSRLAAEKLGLRVLGSALDERGLRALTLSVGPEFPAEPMIILAAHDGTLYDVRRLGDQLGLVASSRKSIVSFLMDSYTISTTPFMGFRRLPKPDERQEKEEDVYREVLRTLIGNSFGLSGSIDPQRLTLGRNHVRLFVYAPLPTSFMTQGDDFPDQRGYVLYVVDLPLTPNKPTP